MADKIHCDLCDDVIDPDVPRLQITTGGAKGVGDDENSQEDDEKKDVCQSCVQAHPILGKLWQEVLVWLDLD